jgi:hypothetical protein
VELLPTSAKRRDDNKGTHNMDLRTKTHNTPSSLRAGARLTASERQTASAIADQIGAAGDEHPVATLLRLVRVWPDVRFRVVGAGIALAEIRRVVVEEHGGWQ